MVSGKVTNNINNFFPKIKKHTQDFKHLTFNILFAETIMKISRNMYTTYISIHSKLMRTKSKINTNSAFFYDNRWKCRNFQKQKPKADTKQPLEETIEEK